MEPLSMMMMALQGLSQQGGKQAPAEPQMMAPPQPPVFIPPPPIPVQQPFSGNVMSPPGGQSPTFSGGMDLSTILPGLALQGSVNRPGQQGSDWSTMLKFGRQF